MQLLFRMEDGRDPGWDSQPHPSPQRREGGIKVPSTGAPPGSSFPFLTSELFGPALLPLTPPSQAAVGGPLPGDQAPLEFLGPLSLLSPPCPCLSCPPFCAQASVSAARAGTPSTAPATSTSPPEGAGRRQRPTAGRSARTWPASARPRSRASSTVGALIHQLIKERVNELTP